MPTPRLRDLQVHCWAGITGLNGPEAVPALLALVEPGARLGSAERVGIYADMYRWRLIEALREDYSRLATALGDSGFAALVGAYVAAHPSRHPSLRHLGAALAGFLAETGAAGHLVDLARLEWARMEAFDAPDATPLELGALRDLPPPQWAALRFRLVPGVSRLRSAWAVHEAWETPTAEPRPHPTVLRVWRQGFRVYHAPIASDEDMALDVVARGGTFAEVCTAGPDGDPEAMVTRAGSLLARWLEDGILLEA